jgi:hypothetical protein
MGSKEQMRLWTLMNRGKIPKEEYAVLHLKGEGVMNLQSVTLRPVRKQE